MNTPCMKVLEAGYEQSSLALRWKHRPAYGPPGSKLRYRNRPPVPLFSSQFQE